MLLSAGNAAAATGRQQKPPVMQVVSYKTRPSQGQCDGIIHLQQFVPPFTCYVSKHSIFISLSCFENFILFLVLISLLSWPIGFFFQPL